MAAPTGKELWALLATSRRWAGRLQHLGNELRRAGAGGLPALRAAFIAICDAPGDVALPARAVAAGTKLETVQIEDEAFGLAGVAWLHVAEEASHADTTLEVQLSNAAEATIRQLERAATKKSSICCREEKEQSQARTGLIAAIRAVFREPAKWAAKAAEALCQMATTRPRKLTTDVVLQTVEYADMAAVGTVVGKRGVNLKSIGQALSSCRPSQQFTVYFEPKTQAFRMKCKQNVLAGAQPSADAVASLNACKVQAQQKLQRAIASFHVTQQQYRASKAQRKTKGSWSWVPDDVLSNKETAQTQWARKSKGRSKCHRQSKRKGEALRRGPALVRNNTCADVNVVSGRTVHQCFRERTSMRRRRGGRQLLAHKAKQLCGSKIYQQMQVDSLHELEAFYKDEERARWEQQRWQERQQQRQQRQEIWRRQQQKKEQLKIKLQKQNQMKKERKRATTSLRVQLDDRTTAKDAVVEASALEQWRALSRHRSWAGQLHYLGNLMRQAKWGDISLLKLAFAVAANNIDRAAANHRDLAALLAAVRLRPPKVQRLVEAMRHTTAALLQEQDQGRAGKGAAEPSAVVWQAKQRMACGLMLLCHDDLAGEPQFRSIKPQALVCQICERRVDPSDGKAYTFAEFQAEYNDRAPQLWAQVGTTARPGPSAAGDKVNEVSAVRMPGQVGDIEPKGNGKGSVACDDKCPMLHF